MALRRLRPRRARTAARAHRAAASVPAACARAGCAARRAQANGRRGAARGVIAPPRSPARCVTIAGKDVEDRGRKQHASCPDRRGPYARGPAGARSRGRHRSARHGLLPRRRPPRRGHRTAGAGDRADPRRSAVETGSQRPVHGGADVRAVLSAQAPQGQAAAVDVARRRSHRRDLRNYAGRPRRLAQPVRPQGLGRRRLRRVERGRAGFASPDVWPSEPIFLNYADPFERFRIGDGEGSWNADPAKRRVLPGSQFPVEAYDNYMRQAVPRWLSTDKAVVDAYVALVDKVCPCVLLLHSQGGPFGFKVAEQRPDKVKAIVAVESASAGDVGKAVALKNTPTLMLFGDYVDQHPRWATY